jgi:hypothetical protein
MNCSELGFLRASMCWQCRMLDGGECVSLSSKIHILNMSEQWDVYKPLIIYSFTKYGDAAHYRAIAKKYYPDFWSKVEKVLLLE